MKVGLVDVARKAGATPTTTRRPERAHLDSGQTPAAHRSSDRSNRGRDPERLREDMALRRRTREPWSTPLHGGVGSLHGLWVMEVARRLAPLGRHRPPADPAMVAERSRRRTSPEGRRPALGRVPARSGDERDLGGDREPMEDKGVPTLATVSRRYGLVDGARPRSRPSLAIPRSGGNVDSGARASASIGNVQVPSTAPAKALRAGEGKARWQRPR